MRDKKIDAESLLKIARAAVNEKFRIAHTTFQIEIAAWDQDEHDYNLVNDKEPKADGHEKHGH